jgi:hypothetical protein
MPGQVFVSIRCVRTGRSMLGRFIDQGGCWNLAEVRVVGQGTSPAGHDQARLTGSFGIAAGYLGCPDCGNRDYVRCNRCGGLTCWYGSSDFLCMTCGLRAAVSGGIAEVNVDDFG